MLVLEFELVKSMSCKRESGKKRGSRRGRGQGKNVGEGKTRFKTAAC